jgi:hypothetical protein
VNATESRMSISRESIILLGICIVDLALTLLLVGRYNALEANPLMGFFLRRGVWSFVLAKLFVFLAAPLAIAEWSRQYRPDFVRKMLRLAIVLYALTLGWAVITQAHGVAAGRLMPVSFAS